MNTAKNQKRNRLIALSFVSILMLVMYGPLAQWFVAADNVLYDVMSGARPSKPLANAYIVSIDPQRQTDQRLLERYGAIIGKLQASGVRRIVLPNPPAIPEAADLPGWSALLTGGPEDVSCGVPE